MASGWHNVAAQSTEMLARPALMHQADTEVAGVLQGWADALMAAAARLPDEEHAKEVAASERASGLLQRAVQAFAQVPSQHRQLEMQVMQRQALMQTWSLIWQWR
jgi:hypothetical protein